VGRYGHAQFEGGSKQKTMIVGHWNLGDLVSTCSYLPAELKYAPPSAKKFNIFDSYLQVREVRSLPPLATDWFPQTLKNRSRPLSLR
jgi:hypothetical protein